METNFVTPSDLRDIYNEFAEHAKPQHYISVLLETKPNDTFSLDIYYTIGYSCERRKMFYKHRIDKSCMYDVIYALSELIYTYDFNFNLC